MVVLEPNSTFPFNNIYLADPQPVQGGGGYFTRITINDKPLNIQLQECNLKSGIVITSRSKYTDLMYSSEQLPKELMYWIEEFENTIKHKIYEHRLTWFANDLTIDDIDVVELNEAFASQSIACIQELNINPDIVNMEGGAIALGHPLGATGTRITAKAASLMVKKNKKYALATQCIGLGQGIATVLERVE